MIQEYKGRPFPTIQFEIEILEMLLRHHDSPTLEEKHKVKKITWRFNTLVVVKQKERRHTNKMELEIEHARELLQELKDLEASGLNYYHLKDLEYGDGR